MNQVTMCGEFWALLVPELSVRDLDRSLRFYRDTLCFTEKFSRPESKFTYLEMGQAQIMLDQICEDPEAMWITAPLEPPLGRGVNFQIEVQDVRALHDRAVEAGYDLFRPLKTAWYRKGGHKIGQIQFLIQDPDGCLLRFMQHLGQRPVGPKNMLTPEPFAKRCTRPAAAYPKRWPCRRHGSILPRACRLRDVEAVLQGRLPRRTGTARLS